WRASRLRRFRAHSGKLVGIALLASACHRGVPLANPCRRKCLTAGTGRCLPRLHSSHQAAAPVYLLAHFVASSESSDKFGKSERCLLKKAEPERFKTRKPDRSTILRTRMPHSVSHVAPEYAASAPPPRRVGFRTTTAIVIANIIGTGVFTSLG